MNSFEDLMALPELDSSQRRKLWMLIKAQHASSPEKYEAEWRPKLAGHPHLDKPLATLSSLKEVKQAVALVPDHASWVLSVDRKPSPKSLKTNALFERISVLDLSEVKKLDDKVLHALAESPHMTSLRTLKIGRNFSDGVTEDGLAALAASPHLSGLEELSIHANRLGEKGARAVLESSTYCLKRLRLSECGLDNAALEYIASSKHMETLRALYLGNSQFDDEGVLALASSPYVGQLSEISLWGNKIGDRGVIALSQKLGEHLDVIELRQNDLGDKGVEALVAAKAMRGVKKLDLTFNKIEDGGAIAIAKSEHLGELELLGLGSNRISDDGAFELLRSKKLGALRTLSIWGNRVSEDVMRELKNSQIHIK